MATNEASEQANRSGMDPKRLVVIFYLLSALALSQFLEHVLGSIFDLAGWPKYELVEGWDVTTIAGVVLAVAIAVAAYLHPRLHQLSLDTATELMRVTWPSWAETRTSTLAVVVVSLAAAGILFGIDTLAYKVMVVWLPKVWGKL